MHSDDCLLSKVCISEPDSPRSLSDALTESAKEAPQMSSVQNTACTVFMDRPCSRIAKQIVLPQHRDTMRLDR